jgi:hypothetical protein
MDPTEELLRADSVDDVDEDLWPETTLLATRWEKNDVVRRIYRSRKKLLLWGKKRKTFAPWRLWPPTGKPCLMPSRFGLLPFPILSHLPFHGSKQRPGFINFGL